MRIMAVLLNHTLSSQQQNQAYQTLAIDRIELPPHSIQQLWADVDPEADTENLPVSKVTNWLETVTTPGDYVLVQGDYAMTFAVVMWCLKHERVALHATTRRDVVEERHGEKVHTSRVFHHVRFRRYFGSD